MLGLLFIFLSSAQSDLGRGLSHRILQPQGMTKNMVYLENPKLISFIMPSCWAIYEANGRKYLVKHSPLFPEKQFRNLILVKGKEDKDALEKTGEKNSFVIFSGGEITQDVLKDYQRRPETVNFPLK